MQLCVSGRVAVGDRIDELNLGIEGGKIRKISKREIRADDRMAARGIILPCGIDVHAHLRDLGQSYKEDWYTGSCAALAGGISMVVDMPNTIPPTVDVRSFLMKLREARRKAVVDFGINCGVENNLRSLRFVWRRGAMAFGEIFADRLGIDIVSRACDIISDLGGVACIHAGEDESRISCLGKALRGRIHFSHVSTLQGLIHGKKRGSVEVTPHHLLLSRKDGEKLGFLSKVNPPLRDERERMALWKHMDLIDVLASDHAPHTVEDKRDGAAGFPTIEVMIPLMLREVKRGKIGIEKFISLITRASKIFSIRCKGGISAGKDADLMIVDLRSERRIRADELHSKCGWTPFEGRIGIFPHTVMIRGEVVYQDGEVLAKPGFGKFVPNFRASRQP